MKTPYYDSDEYILTPGEYDLAVILVEAVTFVAGRIGDNPITFKLYFSEDFPRKLFGVGSLIQQIIIGLLDNAVKHSQGDTIKLAVTCSRDSEEDIWMDIVVSDYGIGIEEHNLTDIFKNIGQDGDDEVESAVMSLPLMKKALDLIEGKISVGSIVGLGSVFSVGVNQGYVSDEVIGSFIRDNIEFEIKDKMISPGITTEYILKSD